MLGAGGHIATIVWCMLIDLPCLQPDDGGGVLKALQEIKALKKEVRCMSGSAL